MAYDDNQKVGDLLKGKSPEEQQRILQGIAEQVAKETKLGNSIDYDFKDYDMKVVFDSRVVAVDSRITPPTGEDYCGSKGCPKGSEEILVDPKFANAVTVLQLKSAMAHELDHVSNTDSFSAGRPHTASEEIHADRVSAEKYGPKTTIEVLETVGKLYPEACVPPRGDPHPSIRAREQAVIEEFPDSHLAIPSPSACPAPKAAEKSR